MQHLGLANIKSRVGTLNSRHLQLPLTLSPTGCLFWHLGYAPNSLILAFKSFIIIIIYCSSLYFQFLQSLYGVIFPPRLFLKCRTCALPFSAFLLHLPFYLPEQFEYILVSHLHRGAAPFSTIPLRLCWGLIHNTHCQSTLHPPPVANLRNHETKTSRCPDTLEDGSIALPPARSLLLLLDSTNPVLKPSSRWAWHSLQVSYDPRHNNVVFLKHQKLGVPHNLLGPPSMLTPSYFLFAFFLSALPISECSKYFLSLSSHFICILLCFSSFSSCPFSSASSYIVVSRIPFPPASVCHQHDFVCLYLLTLPLSLSLLFSAATFSLYYLFEFEIRLPRSSFTFTAGRLLSFYDT